MTAFHISGLLPPLLSAAPAALPILRTRAGWRSADVEGAEAILVQSGQLQNFLPLFAFLRVDVLGYKMNFKTFSGKKEL